MNFVQTGFLIGAAAMAIPVAVHLLSRWQIRRLELGTMRFLQEVIHDSARRRRIRRWFLLCTRAVLVLLLALLFARPYLSEAMSGQGNDLRIVLIDRSSSMGMPGQEGRLIDDALAAAKNDLSELGANVTVHGAWFDRHVWPISADLDRVAPPQVVVGETSYAAALRWARDRLNAFPGSRAEVVLVTDLQRSGLRSETIDGAALSGDDDPSRADLPLTDAAESPSKDNRSLPVFSHPGFEQQGEALYVVNGSAGESDPTRIEKSAFSEILGLTVPEGSDQTSSGNVVAEKRKELWPWLAAAVLILVVGEFSLANRTTA